MGKLALPVGGQCGGVQVRQMAVHVPFDIADRQPGEKAGERFKKPVHDFPALKIQHELIAAYGGLSAGHAQRPVRMRAKELGILAHHLRLDPEPDLQAHVGDFVQERVKAVGQLARIRKPVAETRVIVVPVSEPAVVDDQHVHAELLCLARKAQELVLIEVKIHGLPTVEEDRPLGEGNVPAADVFADKAVIRVGERRKAAHAAREQDLRCIEVLSRLQEPGEALAVDAGHHAHRAGLIQLDIRPVVPGVDRHDAKAQALVLRRVRLAEDDEGIVLMTRRAAL